MPKKQKIALFTTPQGHQSIADAIQEKIERLAGDRYEVVQYFSDALLMKEYGMVYKFAPYIFSIPYNLSKIKQAASVSKKIFLHKFTEPLTEFIEREKPDLCINTNFVYNASLEKICTEKNIPFINTLANPGAAHPLEVSELANYNLVFDTATQFNLETLYPNCTFFTTGWFVRDIFETEYSATELRKKFSIPPDTFHMLISSGSEGTGAVLKILPSLLRVNEPVVITVACGKSKLLADQVNITAKFVGTVSPNVEIRVLPFTKKMHEYMQAADLVVGKAGPNTLFETVATKTPFFAITHVAGQEDINLEIIADEKLGFVEESVLGASRLLASIIADTQLLEPFQKPVEKMAEHNKKSGELLLEVIQKVM